MRLLFDLGHPAHYYLYKFVIRHLREKGDKILLVVRDREKMVANLLKEEGEDFVLLGGHVRSIAGKACYMVMNDIRLLRIASRFRPDIFVSMNSPYSAHISFLMRRPHLSFTDTENSKIIFLLLAPFTDTMITPTAFRGSFAFRKKVKVDCYKSLAYIHPRYFSPDPKVLQEAGINTGEKFVMVRFSAYDASHDIGLRGLGERSRKRIVSELSKHAKVFLTSEVGLSEELKRHVPLVRINRMHDLLAFSSLYVGEGSTMAIEVGLLGVPSVLINPSRCGVFEDLERNGLLKQFFEPENQLEEIIEYCKKTLLTPGLKSETLKRRNQMLSKMDDLTESIIEEVEKFRKGNSK